MDIRDCLNQKLAPIIDHNSQNTLILSSILSTGAQSLTLAALSKRLPRPILFITQDDNDLRKLSSGLSSFASSQNGEIFPAWDCRSYDGMAAQQGLQAQRAYIISRIHNGDVPRLILSTVNAVLQKIPKHSFGSGLILRSGEQINPIAFRETCVSLGYTIRDTTIETGDVCFRGGIIDIFPAGVPQPCRLDLFGDTIESIRTFDYQTQRTTGTVDHLELFPAREWVMDKSTQTRFLAHTRRILGRQAALAHPWFNSVEAGGTPPGLEHALPLLSAEMCGLTEILGPSVTTILGLGVEEQLKNRQEQQAANLTYYRQTNEENTLILDDDRSLYLDLSVDRALYDNSWQFVSPSHLTHENTVILPFASGHDFTLSRQRTAALDEVIKLWRSNAKTSRITIFCHTADSRKKLYDSLLYRLNASRLYNDSSKSKSEASQVQMCDLDDVFASPSCISLVVGDEIEGFQLVGNNEDWFVCHESDLFGKSSRARAGYRRKKSKDHLIVRQLHDICPGDLLVDEEYGIGRFESLETIPVEGIKHDCIKLTYAGGDKLYVPVESLDRLSRYNARLDDSEARVSLDRLGTASWQQRKAKTKKDLLASAQVLLEQAAERQLGSAPRIISDDRLEQFSNGSGFVPTDDQRQIIAEVLEQISSNTPSERLVSGDAGYGKTEIALHASFVTAMQGYQVLLLAPTTLLVRQHFNVFLKRFKGWPIRIEQLSRLVPAAMGKQVKTDVADGRVNILIGTHSLLSKSIKFCNVGLIVIDEEQHFGVKQKEILKNLATNSHMITLSATPIPRTLQLAISGLQDLSILATPPLERLGTRCFLTESDSPSLGDAVRQELDRDGQVFYVCPHISDIEELAKRIRRWFPGLDFVVAHGQMPVKEMESAVQKFVSRETKILLSTPIVESGLDIPNANTIIVHRAERFGISQLYQLRGRVGRGNARGWCYLTTKHLPAQSLAKRRLETLVRLNDRGMGLSVAAHDLDARGAGNLLGEQQSGHIKEIGVELYQKMLREVLAELRSGKNTDNSVTGNKASSSIDEDGRSEPSFNPDINLGVDVYIDDRLAPEVHFRMSLYREASRCETEAELIDLKTAWQDRLGELPEPTQNIFRVLDLKLLCRQAHVSRFDAGARGGIIQFHEGKPQNVDAVMQVLKRFKSNLTLRSDMSIKITRAWRDSARRLMECKDILRLMIGPS